MERTEEGEHPVVWFGAVPFEKRQAPILRKGFAEGRAVQHLHAGNVRLRWAGACRLQVDDANVTGFLKRSVDGGNAIAGAIALSNAPHEFWLHFGPEEIGPADARRPVRAIENLVTGERHIVEWGGVRLRIDPASDPAILFRCIA